MKQLQKSDNIKLRVSLISKLNNRQRINMNDLLLRVEFDQQQNDFLKFMLEVQALKQPESTLEDTKDIERKVKEKLSVPFKDAEEEWIVRSLLIKVWAIRLLKEIVRQPVQTLKSSVKKIVSQLNKLEELRLMNKTMFNLNSLLSVGFQDIGKITQTHFSAKQNNSIRQIVGLIKLLVKPQEGREILETSDLGEGVSVDKFIKDRQNLKVVMKELIDKEKDLLNNIKQAESDNKSKYLLSEIEKAIIRNIIEADFKLYLDGPRMKVFEDINKMNQSCYILASSLVNLYFETKPEVLFKIRNTQFFRYLITSKSTSISRISRISRISQGSRVSKGSRVQKPKRNPKLYENYILNSNIDNEQIHKAKCKDGEYFLKFNFGNNKSSRKFVQITEENIRWSAKKVQIKSGTKEKMDEVLGLVYGKITQRHLENYSLKPQFCLSLILKGRTLDLAIQKNQDLEQMFSFIRGGITIINEHHQHKKAKLEKKYQQLKEDKKEQREELEEKIKSLHNKVQSINKGKLLWKNLFLTLGSKVKMSDDADSYQRKAKGITQLSKKIQSSPLKSASKSPSKSFSKSFIKSPSKIPSISASISRIK